jgi:hypothetical protein
MQTIKSKLDVQSVEQALAQATADIDRESKLSEQERKLLKEKRVAMLKANLEKNEL